MGNQINTAQSQIECEIISIQRFLWRLYKKPQKSPQINEAIINMKFREATCTIVYMVVANKKPMFLLNFLLRLFWIKPLQNISSAGPIRNANAIDIYVLFASALIE